MIKHYKIKVSGHVQGVNFRSSASRKAESLGISGYVMNHADGTVLMQAEGEGEKLQELVEWCKHGPTLAKVTGVEYTEELPAGFSGFEIRHFDF